MIVSPSRHAAIAMLSDMRQGMLLDQTFDRRTASLDPRDRRWVQELVFGVLRVRGPIDVALDRRARGGTARLDDDLVDLLRLGTYQLLHMNSVPAYAAIAQTVELVKQRHGRGAAGLANAVLRRLDRERDLLANELERVAGDRVDVLAARTSHPVWLVSRWVETFGWDDATRLLEFNNREAPIVLRPWNLSVEELARGLAAAGVETTSAPWLSDGLQLLGGVALNSLDIWREGHAFVQDPAATLVARFADVPANSVVADLCAAPGGKALELSREARVVIALDRSERRMGRVSENLRRLGVDNILPVVGDASEPIISAVDAVLVDAPCTGTGTFRRHPDARWRLRVSDVAIMSRIQRTILDTAAAAVRPGGLLVYSTCSVEPEENDAQVAEFLNRHPSFRIEPPQSGAVPADVMGGEFLRLLPHQHGVDGAFAARLRRASA